MADVGSSERCGDILGTTLRNSGSKDATEREVASNDGLLGV